MVCVGPLGHPIHCDNPVFSRAERMSVILGERRKTIHSCGAS